MARAKANVVVIPTFHPTTDVEYQGKTRTELRSLAESGKPAQKKRATAELERRVANKPYKLWKKAQKASA